MPTQEQLLKDQNKRRIDETFKKLSVCLVYPAVLGFFLFEVIDPLMKKQTIDTISTHIGTLALWAKGGLLFGTIVFFCCDFLSSECYSRYTRWSFLMDLFTICALTIAFRHIGTGERLRERDVDTSWVLGCFLAFLGIYILRYYFYRRIKYPKDTVAGRRYRRLVKFEWFLLSAFLAILILSIWSHFDNSIIVALSALVSLIAGYIYIIVLNSQHELDQEETTDFKDEKTVKE